METHAQKKIRQLLKLELSIPERVYDRLLRVNVIMWRLQGPLDGSLHRDFGPAIEAEDGSYEAWYRYDELHREDGPAYVNGKIIQYWVRGVQMSKREFLDYQKYGITDDGN